MLAPDTVQAHGESGVGISMTIYHGSVKRMSGHILVKMGSLMRSPLDSKIWILAGPMIVRGSYPTPNMFWCHRRKFYYMNGRGQVYETDIGENIVIFDPVCRQKIDHTYHEVNFKLMEKVEWVFL